jgi:hypothetical protein
MAYNFRLLLKDRHSSLIILFFSRNKCVKGHQQKPSNNKSFVSLEQEEKGETINLKGMRAIRIRFWSFRVTSLSDIIRI